MKTCLLAFKGKFTWKANRILIYLISLNLTVAHSIQESHESFKFKMGMFLKKVVLYIAREIEHVKFLLT